MQKIANLVRCSSYFRLILCTVCHVQNVVFGMALATNTGRRTCSLWATDTDRHLLLVAPSSDYKCMNCNTNNLLLILTLTLKTNPIPNPNRPRNTLLLVNKFCGRTTCWVHGWGAARPRTVFATICSHVPVADKLLEPELKSGVWVGHNHE